MQLKAQYAVLHRHFAGEPAQPSLPGIAALLGCSERNARVRLQKMQALGWLHWTSGRGRGRRSTLQLLVPPQQPQLDELAELVGQGRLEQAFNRLRPAQRKQLMQRLPEFLGAAPRDRLLRIAAPRPLVSLDPLEVSSRLESHVVRQVFDRLCRFDAERQCLRPALAHHWEPMDQARRWRFWLRPGLRFHDGSPLQATDVAHSVLRLRDARNPWQRQYLHLRGVEVHDELSLSFELEAVDQLWPNRLVTANASIVPRRRRADFARLPVGSGPFRVSRHNALRLSLEANDGYYRERPLIDQVDLWFVPGEASFDLEPADRPGSHDARLQSACAYLLASPRAGLGPVARRRWARFLHDPPLVDAADLRRMPARALLPEWPPVHWPEEGRCPWPAGRRVTLVSYETPGLRALAQALEHRLAAVGVTLVLRMLDYEAFAQPAQWWPQADLALCSEVLHDDRDYGCVEWWGSSRVLRGALPEEAAARLDRKLALLQREPDAGQRAAAVRAIGAWLVEDGWMVPLAHEWQGVRARSPLQGVALGSLGWADFSTLWLRE